MTEIVYDTFIPLPAHLQQSIGGDTSFKSLDEVISSFAYYKMPVFKLKLKGKDMVIVIHNHSGEVLIYREVGKESI